MKVFESQNQSAQRGQEYRFLLHAPVTRRSLGARGGVSGNVARHRVVLCVESNNTKSFYALRTSFGPLTGPCRLESYFFARYISTGTLRMTRSRFPSSTYVRIVHALTPVAGLIFETRTSGPRYPPNLMNPPSNSQNRSILGVVLHGGGSSSGFLVWKPPNRFISPGGFLTIKYPLSVFNKNSIHDLMIIERKISFQEKLYSHRKI